MSGILLGEATIASGQTTSGEIALGNNTLVKIFMPAAFTGVLLTFTGSTTSGGTFLPLEDGAGVAVSKTVSASKIITLDPNEVFGIEFLKIVSGSAELAARTLELTMVSL